MSFGPAITATIGADVGPLQQAGPKVERAVGGLAQKMEHRIVGTQHLATAAATALGLNVEKMAEHVAAHLFGITEEAKKAWTDLADLSTQLADRQIAASRAKLDLGKQYQLSLQDEARLRARIDENVFSSAEKQVQKKRDQLALLDKEAATAALLNKINEQNYAEENARDENRRKIAQQVADIKAADAAAEKKSNEQMAQESLAWYKAWDKAEKEKKAAKLAAIEEVKAAEIAAFDAAAAVEKARVAEMFKSMIDQWTGFTGLINTVGRGDKELSDRELDKKIANLKGDIFTRETNQFQHGGFDFFLDPQRSNLSQALAEQQLRGDVRRNVSTFGEDRARDMFGGSDQRFDAIMRGFVDRQEQLNNRLLDRLTTGIKVIPIPAGSL